MVGVPVMTPADDTVTPGGHDPSAENVSASASENFDATLLEMATPTVPLCAPMFGPGNVGGELTAPARKRLPLGRAPSVELSISDPSGPRR